MCVVMSEGGGVGCEGLMWKVCEGGECKEECEEGWVVKREGWEERSGGWLLRENPPEKWVWPRGLVG